MVAGDVYRGTRVRVTGAPDRFEPNTCYLGTAVFEDGTRVDRYGQISRPAAARRQRPVRGRGGCQTGGRILPVNGRPSSACSPTRAASAGRSCRSASRAGSRLARAGRHAGVPARAERHQSGRSGQRVLEPAPSIRPLTAAGAKAMEGFDGASTDNPRLRCEPTSILFDWTFEST